VHDKLHLSKKANKPNVFELPHGWNLGQYWRR